MSDWATRINPAKTSGGKYIFDLYRYPLQVAFGDLLAEPVVDRHADGSFSVKYVARTASGVDRLRDAKKINPVLGRVLGYLRPFDEGVRKLHELAERRGDGGPEHEAAMLFEDSRFRSGLDFYHCRLADSNGNRLVVTNWVGESDKQEPGYVIAGSPSAPLRFDGAPTGVDAVSQDGGRSLSGAPRYLPVMVSALIALFLLALLLYFLRPINVVQLAKQADGRARESSAPQDKGNKPATRSSGDSAESLPAQGAPPLGDGRKGVPTPGEPRPGSDTSASRPSSIDSGPAKGVSGRDSALSDGSPAASEQARVSRNSSGDDNARLLPDPKRDSVAARERQPRASPTQPDSGISAGGPMERGAQGLGPAPVPQELPGGPIGLPLLGKPPDHPARPADAVVNQSPSQRTQRMDAGRRQSEGSSPTSVTGNSTTSGASPGLAPRQANELGSSPSQQAASGSSTPSTDGGQDRPQGSREERRGPSSPGQQNDREGPTGGRHQAPSLAEPKDLTPRGGQSKGPGARRDAQLGPRTLPQEPSGDTGSVQGSRRGGDKDRGSEHGGRPGASVTPESKSASGAQSAKPAFRPGPHGDEQSPRNRSPQGLAGPVNRRVRGDEEVPAGDRAGEMSERLPAGRAGAGVDLSERRPETTSPGRPRTGSAPGAQAGPSPPLRTRDGQAPSSDIAKRNSSGPVIRGDQGRRPAGKAGDATAGLTPRQTGGPVGAGEQPPERSLPTVRTRDSASNDPDTGQTSPAARGEGEFPPPLSLETAQPSRTPATDVRQAPSPSRPGEKASGETPTGVGPSSINPLSPSRRQPNPPTGLASLPRAASGLTPPLAYQWNPLELSRDLFTEIVTDGQPPSLHMLPDQPLVIRFDVVIRGAAGQSVTVTNVEILYLPTRAR